MVESVQSTTEGASADEVDQVIAELTQYRERLTEDFLATAKKAKLPKSMVMAQLEKHPEIVKIDEALAKLRGEDAGSEKEAASEEESI